MRLNNQASKHGMKLSQHSDATQNLLPEHVAIQIGERHYCGHKFPSPPLSISLDLSLSLAHAVHDHVKRDYIFCLSTANGNTYYLQVNTGHVTVM